MLFTLLYPAPQHPFYEMTYLPPIIRSRRFGGIAPSVVLHGWREQICLRNAE